MEEYEMSMKDMERMKDLIEEKKTKGGFLPFEKKIGSGSVEKRNKNIGLDFTRTKKISQQMRVGCIIIYSLYLLGLYQVQSQ